MSASSALVPPRPAPTRRQIHPLLRQRYSPHAFRDEPVSPKATERVLEAARWAPSSFNEQPWRFLVADRFEQPGTHAAIVDVLAEGNQAWASKAPVLILTAAKTSFDRNGEENPHARHDVGLAMAQFTMQATAEGLGVHQMGGFDAEQAKRRFGLADDVDPVTVVALGRPAPRDEIPADLAEREEASRQRRPLEEIVLDG